jgi:hypothetical protein
MSPPAKLLMCLLFVAIVTWALVYAKEWGWL